MTTARKPPRKTCEPEIAPPCLTMDDLDAEIETLEGLLKRKEAEYHETAGAIKAVMALKEAIRAKHG